MSPTIVWKQNPTVVWAQDAEWEESKHPRKPSGQAGGGEFTSGGSGGEKSTEGGGEQWHDQPVSEKSVHAMISSLKSRGTPVERAMLNQVKDIRIGTADVPGSSGHQAMAINVRSGTLYVNPRSEYSAMVTPEGERVDTSKAKLNTTSLSALRHELGHLSWESVKTTLAAKSFVEAVKKDIQAGRSISGYQALMFDRFKRGKVSLDRVMHESYAEWMRFGLSNSRGAPAQYDAAKKVADEVVRKFGK